MDRDDTSNGIGVREIAPADLDALGRDSHALPALALLSLKPADQIKKVLWHRLFQHLAVDANEVLSNGYASIISHITPTMTAAIRAKEPVIATSPQ